MDNIYQDTCRVRDLEELKMVVPKGLSRDQGKVVKFPINQKGEKYYGLQ